MNSLYEIRQQPVLQQIRDKITIVILSRNRQSYLLRQIAFWQGQSMKVIIADQSPKPLVIPENLASPCIRYFHGDITLVERLIQVTAMIDTDYTIFLPDDEFHIPSCLEKCISFLEQNPDYSSCAGRSMAFQIDSEICGYLIYENLKGFDISDDMPFRRIMKLANPYKFQPIHSVLRTDVWKLAVKVFNNGIDTPPDMFELVFGFTAAFVGKLRVIPELMNLRSRENEPVNTADWRQDRRLPVWLFDQSSVDQQVRFFMNLSQVSGNEDRVKGEYATAICLGFIHYLGREKSDSKTSASFLFPNVLAGFKSMLPRQTFYFLKRVKHNMLTAMGKTSTAREPLLPFCERMVNAGEMGIDREMIDIIYDHIGKFHSLQQAKR